ncbi:hypothetical protein LTR56_012244 [Elasticomyces elasticus]|nr:hypothetical protein LTR56_012244 [Elasticomyces elasticus]KAK3653045.1 hypothetical protein LTR22_011433 [Elasticomyces elasticus]KAK4919558.1 hypothetical protein LTR49_012778 [Elasticomyces elasticus]KAK5763098.1 hypothetical protein LTS12_006687 [Elasticomyces elasticus]
MAAFTDSKNPITTPAPSYRSTRSLRSTPSYHTTENEDIEMSPAADIEPAVQNNETNASLQATRDHSLFTGLSWLVLFIVTMVLVLVFRPKKSYDCPKLDDGKEYYRTKCGPQHAAFAVAMAIVMGKVGATCCDGLRLGKTQCSRGWLIMAAVAQPLGFAVVGGITFLKVWECSFGCTDGCVEVVA